MEERGIHDPDNQIAVFRDIAEALNRANDISAAMDAILPRLGEALGLQTAWAFRYDEQRRSFVEVGASGLPPALDECAQKRLRTGWCECQSQFVQRELDEAVNIVRCSRLKSAVGDTGNLHFHASIPLRSKSKPLGILNLAAPGGTVFDADALAFLATVGQQVAVAMDRAQMLQTERDHASRLQRLAQISADWGGYASPEGLLQRAVESYAREYGYRACGVVRRAIATENDTSEMDVVAVAEIDSDLDAFQPYIYNLPQDHHPEPSVESVLLAQAKSALSAPIAMTPFALRLESDFQNAFCPQDALLLQAFAWQVSASYVHAASHQQELHSAQLQERHRIAAELHDSVSQRLFSAQFLLKTATAQWNANPSDAPATMRRVEELLSESQQEMRDLIRALRRMDRTMSLFDELQERVRTLAMSGRMGIALLGVDGPDMEPSPAVRTTLLAIVDEALHNALKHANASTITIRLQRKQTRLGVYIEDDGMGCLESRIGTGLGTRTMFERASAIGGTVAFRSQLGKGTVVEVWVPMNIDAEGEDRS